jgi:hypothetical protein
MLKGALASGADEARWDPPDRPHQTVQIGGAPGWIQGDETPACPVCGGSMKLLVQVDAEISNPAHSQSVWLPFGSGGVAYAFMCGDECSPEGTYLMWQTT